MAYNPGTSTAMTITAGSLGSGVARSSAAVTSGTTNNTSNIWLTINILTAAIAPSGNKQAVVYGYLSEDGTNYIGNSGTADNVDGTDKQLTAVGSPTNLYRIGTIQLNQGAVAVTVRGVFDVMRIFGGAPRKWGFVLGNDAGTAFGGTVTATYSESYYT